MQTFELRNFYVGEASDFHGMLTKLLTLNATLRIGIYNPAPTFGIHVSSTSVSLFYYQLPIATGQVIILFVVKKFSVFNHTRKT